MRRFAFLFTVSFLFLLILSCGVQRSGVNHHSSKLELKSAEQSKDSTDYELIIFDPGFDFWLNSKAESKEMYTNDYLSSINRLMVQEWNRRYSAGDRRFASFIDYDISEEYSLDLNYRLFMYFRYFQEINRIRLVPGIR